MYIKYFYVILFFLTSVIYAEDQKISHAFDEQKTQAYIALIIDDLGYRIKNDKRAINLNGKISYAFLPNTPHARRLANLAHENNKDVMLHLPMESEQSIGHEAGVLTTQMEQQEFIQLVKKNLSVIPHVSGINNHMGSMLTQSDKHMNWLMSFLSSIDYSTELYIDELFLPMPKEASMVFNATRFGRDAEKKQLLSDLFAPVKQLKADALIIESLIEQAKIYLLAAQGITIIRKRIVHAKKQSKVMNYDDLINQLADSLNGSQSQTLAQQIKEQYPAALVDEFQDTDPQQYLILNAIYQNDPAIALYMIGDPKQAIYAFRSGDIFTYLAAREKAHYQWILDTNWRSSTAMINAYNRVFYGSAKSEDGKDIFGFDINYSWIKSAMKADENPIIDKQTNAALQLVYFPFDESYRSGKSKKQEMKQEFCPSIANWCAGEVARLVIIHYRNRISLY